jgi:glycosyltransferase involved in cell wall biosynthesis
MTIDSQSSHLNKTLDIVIPVYNDNPYLAETLTSIFNQQLPNSWCFQIYVVDDGSNIPVSLDIPEKNMSNVSLIRLERNSGCSVARNKGAYAGNGEVTLFLDADCSLVTAYVLALLLEQYRQGYDVCFGQINAPQGDFWAKYQNDVAEERASRFKGGEKSSMTTQIFMVNRQVFESAGGFDEAYHFGFEDRDLFISLIKSGARIALEEKALVNHNDQLSLRSVTKKLFKSGESSSKRFIQKHPKEYKYLPYAKADVRYSTGGARILAYIAKPMLWPLVRVVSWGINKRLFPFYVAKKLVKYTSGLAYLIGTKAAQGATG